MPAQQLEQCQREQAISQDTSNYLAMIICTVGAIAAMADKLTFLF